ncbi:translocation protein SEC63 homolog [Anneissia japonica]|uniref:translocation protein SEC63 homolog n=1 Tax=Anneissia japonica TaxID=1529436 RepID=UPI001425B973|nr:translocation protein SEC63 homolog [Anneissia japonica]
MAQFEYDESGGTSLYFLVSFYALFLIPITYWLIPSRQKENKEEEKDSCKCEGCVKKKAVLLTVTPKKTLLSTLKWILLVLAWCLFIALAYKASQLERDHQEYDPFEILGLDREASEGEIRRQYRSLSRQFHPDKETGDEKMFMRIAKAYEALTNEDSKVNWQKYGNPDGPTAATFGIALPAWIVDQSNSVWILAVYTLAFMVILPIAVGTWWYRSIKYSAVEVLLETTQIYFYFIHKTPAMNLKRALMILGASLEFRKTHNKEIDSRPSDNEELPKIMRDLDVGQKNKEQPLCQPYSVKARVLMHAHLSRLSLPPNTLQIDKEYIVRKCPMLIHEMVSTAGQIVFYKNIGRAQHEPKLESVENMMKMCAMIVQACWDKKSPLYQLPHFNEKTVHHCGSRKHNIKTLVNFAKMKNINRRQMLTFMSDKEYEDVKNVCFKLPYVNVEHDIQVRDDEDTKTVTEGCLVTVVVTLKRNSIESHFEVGTEEPEEEQEDAGDETEDRVVEVEVKVKPKVWEKQKKKGNKKKGGGGNAKKKQKAKKAIANKTKPNGVISTEVVEAEKEKENSESGSDIEGDYFGDEDAIMVSSTDDDEEDDWNTFQSDIKRKEKVLEGQSRESHIVHCPYFPDVKQEWWWVYIADRKTKKLITVPNMVYDLKPEQEKEVLLQFTASKKGLYHYHICVSSDSYIDLNRLIPMKLTVHEAKEVKVEPSDNEEEKDDNESDGSDYTTDEDNDYSDDD